MSESIQQIGAENDQQQHTLKFIAEQLSLTFTAPNGRRYTTDMLILAFTWFHKSSACYQIIQRHLALPSVRMLRDVASYLNVGANNTTFKYLRNKVNYLNPTELLVTLQLDEIHVKPKVSYQSGQLYGNASNRDQKQANRIQVFMISSVLSSNKDVVSLVPVQKMTAQDLCSMTQEVIKTVTAAGYNIVAILSDNNVINRKMFMELSGTKTLVPFILNPVNKIDRIYLLFDTVHLLKCIRNNWINEADKTFVYPSFTDSTSVMHASFSNLIELYHIEKANVLKDGYLLNWKALFPNAIERQNVKLALRIFDRTTVAALQTLGPVSPKLVNWEGTAEFMNIVIKFWTIVNVKNTTKGVHKRLDDAKVLNDTADSRLQWLQNMASWLKLWNNQTTKAGHLTKETFTALSHTVETLVLLVKHLLQHHKLSYVLLGKFQTDNLEARFGQYRMMCGTNYLVTVKEVLQSEKKLKLKSLLKLYSRSKGVVKIKDFLGEFSDPCKEKCDSQFLATFPYAKITTKVSDDVLSSLLYTSGYVARKAMNHTDCNECKDLFGNKHNSMDLQVDPEHLIYTEILDRGGLIYPSNLLFKVLQVAYNIFNLCVVSDLEGSFLKVKNQRYTLIGVIEQHLSSNDDFIGIYYTCDECDVTYFTRLLRALMCFSNICLNNYSKNMSDSTSSSKKQSQKKTAKLNWYN